MRPIESRSEQISQFGYSVVLTTPLVIGEIKDKSHFLRVRETAWLEYFERNLKKTRHEDMLS
jgi:hypothetical protein